MINRDSFQSLGCCKLFLKLLDFLCRLSLLVSHSKRNSMHKFYAKVPAWTLCNSNCRASILAWAFATTWTLQSWVLISFALCRLVWDRQWMSKPTCVARSLDRERSQVASLIGLVLEVTCTFNESFHFTHVVDVSGYERLKQQSGSSICASRASLFPIQSGPQSLQQHSGYTHHVYLRLSLLQNAFCYSMITNDQSDPLNPFDFVKVTIFPDHLDLKNLGPWLIFLFLLTFHVLKPQIYYGYMSEVRVVRCCNK